MVSKNYFLFILTNFLKKDDENVLEDPQNDLENSIFTIALHTVECLVLRFSQIGIHHLNNLLKQIMNQGNFIFMKSIFCFNKFFSLNFKRKHKQYSSIFTGVNFGCFWIDPENQYKIEKYFDFK